MTQPLAKTGLFVNKQPGGMFAVEDQSLSTGSRFFVDAGGSGAGSTSSFGRNPEAPLSTLALGFSLDILTADSGDIVYLMPGHVEAVIAAGTITADIAGVTVKGLGDKDSRPIISFTTIDSADIDIDAANITFENISFRCDIASLIAAIDVNASGFTLRNCSFMGTDAVDEAFLISVITDANADDMTIENCQFHYLNAEDGTAITTTSTECIRLVGADRAKIRHNYISGDFTTAAINGITTTSDDILLLNNIIQNIATENITGGIDLEASTTGFLDGNMLYVDDPTDPEDAIDDGSCAIGVNWVTNAIGTAPIIWGSAGSGGVEGKIDIIDGYHDVPSLDSTDNNQMRDVSGNKTDAGAQDIAADKSMVAYLKGALDILAGTAGIATWKAAAAPANAVSISEAIRYMVETQLAAILVDTGTTLPDSLGTKVTKTAAFTSGAGTGDIGTFALFTVTGAVKFAIIATCSETLVGAATLECGVAGTTAGIIAQIADATALIAGEIWADATPTLKLDTLANSELPFVIGDGADIFLTIGGANLTDGTIDFNIVWTPLNATGNVVAA